MLIRHCDVCNTAINKKQAYIKISLECDGIEGPTIVGGGLPLHIQGDYCSIYCLQAQTEYSKK